MSTDDRKPSGPPYPPATKVYQRYKIDGVRKALRMAERLKTDPNYRAIFNYAEIMRSAEEILKNASQEEGEQENARRMYLEAIAMMDLEDMPSVLRPVVSTARSILEIESEKK